ncbi:MAG: hypothetical protein J6Z34_06310 [Clostridia bacterium]|nr:hypothetical protein [Clostridia bacterium]
MEFEYKKIRWEKRLRHMRVSTIAILVSLILLIMFAGFTIYGNKVGNFIVNINNGGVRIALSAKEDMSERSSRLTFSGLSGQGETTFVDIPSDISNGMGDKSDKLVLRYLAYSFYLINESENGVDYVMDLNVIDTVGDPLSVLRVMVIEGDKPTNDPSNMIFAKDEPTTAAQEVLKATLLRYGYYETRPFVSDSVLFSIRGRDLPPEVGQKYTVVIWTEGWDAQCTDDRLGDRVKMQIDILAS